MLHATKQEVRLFLRSSELWFTCVRRAVHSGKALLWLRGAEVYLV